MIASQWAGLMLGGGLGAVVRFRVDRLITARAGAWFPVGTLAVNLSGAALLGLIAGAALSPSVALVGGTGFIGSYTTFSTWLLETSRLAEERQRSIATVNVAVSVVVGTLAVGCGQLLGKHL